MATDAYRCSKCKKLYEGRPEIVYYVRHPYLFGMVTSGYLCHKCAKKVQKVLKDGS